MLHHFFNFLDLNYRRMILIFALFILLATEQYTLGKNVGILPNEIFNDYYAGVRVKRVTPPACRTAQCISDCGGVGACLTVDEIYQCVCVDAGR